MKPTQLMNTHSLWAKLFAAFRGAAFVLRQRRNSRNKKRPYKAGLYELENEGGNLVPRPQAPDAIETTGSA